MQEKLGLSCAKLRLSCAKLRLSWASYNVELENRQQWNAN